MIIQTLFNQSVEIKIIKVARYYGSQKFCFSSGLGEIRSVIWGEEQV